MGGSGAALTELECEYRVDDANKATKETFKVGQLKLAPWTNITK